ncbi:MAG: PDZ domain-containing protein [Bacteroidia bacterium]
MNYILSFDQPHAQLVDVCIETTVGAGETLFHLPRWRPGRYELQRYDRLIADLVATDADGGPLPLVQRSTHSWALMAATAGAVRLCYRFYANQPDAGGSFFDASQIYLNGINLLLYRETRLDKPCTLRLHLPSGYRLACGLPQASDGLIHAPDYHTLVDAPLFAAPDLLHHSLLVQDIPIHLWFMGACQPDLDRIGRDIRSYTEAQLTLFGGLPVDQYHYLYLMLPNDFRHGVEHHNSTVIAMGPGHRLMQPAFYRSFLEISSHEFFHTWNVKALRPADMWPYNYSRENYSRLHYITEGITTYYGDLMLWKAGVWGLDQWLESINGELMQHYQMVGKDHVSLEEASFRSWTNGYTSEGIPHRKISFYTKGYLVAMLLDMQIRRATDDQYSLDTVMARLYRQVALAGRGYTEADFREVLVAVAGQRFDAFFEAYVAGVEPLDPALAELGSYYGLLLTSFEPASPAEGRLGLRTRSGSSVIDQLLPGSPLLEAGLSRGDELVAIDGHRLNGNLDDWLTHLWPNGRVHLHYFHRQRLMETVVTLPDTALVRYPQFVALGQATPAQQRRREAWQRVDRPEPVYQP